MRTILCLTAAAALWAQTTPAPAAENPAAPVPATHPADPGAKQDPVSKVGPVSALTEPELACAGNRPELLDYPNLARTAHVDSILTADYTVTPEGKLKDLKFTSVTQATDKTKLFEDVVREYLEQSDFPPGCEKEPKQLHIEFFFKGDPAPERKTKVEFMTPNTFKVSVNPDMTVPLPNSADRTRK